MKSYYAFAFIIELFASSFIYGQNFVKDQLVSHPQMVLPQKGSIGGTASSFRVDGSSLNRGSFSIPLPISYPEERSSILFKPTPHYNQDNGISEFGLGWQTKLCVVRTRTKGELNFIDDDLATPFGTMNLGNDGYYYPYELSRRLRLEFIDNANISIYDSEGSVYFFGGDYVENGGLGFYKYCLKEAIDRYKNSTLYSYERNSSGKLFLKEVNWGPKDDQYQHKMELYYDTIQEPTASYKSGIKSILDRRVTQLDFLSRDADKLKIRFSYNFEYLDDTWGSGLYLNKLTKTYSSGVSEPPIAFETESWSPDHLKFTRNIRIWCLR